MELTAQSDPARGVLPASAPKSNRGPAAGPGNRKALIDAARREFQEGGAAVPLSRVAKRAGVGQGSLYRHFKDRAALATAVFEENLELARQSIRAAERPYATFCDVLAAQAAETAVMIELVSADGAIRGDGDLRSQVRALVEEVHEAACEVGELREGVEAQDLLAAVSMLALPLAHSIPEELPDRTRRIRRILDSWFLHP